MMIGRSERGLRWWHRLRCTEEFACLPTPGTYGSTLVSMAQERRIERELLCGRLLEVKLPDDADATQPADARRAKEIAMDF